MGLFEPTMKLAARIAAWEVYDNGLAVDDDAGLDASRQEAVDIVDEFGGPVVEMITAMEVAEGESPGLFADALAAADGLKERLNDWTTTFNTLEPDDDAGYAASYAAARQMLIDYVGRLDALAVTASVERARPGTFADDLLYALEVIGGTRSAPDPSDVL